MEVKLLPAVCTMEQQVPLEHHHHPHGDEAFGGKLPLTEWTKEPL